MVNARLQFLDEQVNRANMKTKNVKHSQEENVAQESDKVLFDSIQTKLSLLNNF